MNYFEFRNGELFAEDVSVEKLSKEVGTPFYVYSHKTLVRHFNVFNDAAKDLDHIVCYSVKANSNIAVLRTLAKLGSGFDIVSGGELYRVLVAGGDPKKVVYSGVGKTDQEIEFAIENDILMFNVESEEELDAINEVATRLNKKARVSLRINPDVDPQTHPYISTGLSKNKFGIPWKKAVDVYKKAFSMSNLDVVGIDAHIGSQLTKTSPFVDSLKRLLDLVKELRSLNMDIKYLDLGGGLGIRYKDEEPPTPEQYANEIKKLVEGLGITVIFEPGRVMVGNVGIFVTKVLYRKENEKKKFIIVDGAMNDLVRPALYGAYHEILPVRADNRGKKVVADIVGPICESDDFLAKDREIIYPERGDLLAVFSAGAYGFSMASNYNSRPRVPEVMVKGDQYSVIRQRENYPELIWNEKIPMFLR